ncbi:GL21746 [Drosophila persimilis]|uniref:GL21746 n=1 Tax=Drosophila persimilis TaxID=7234 RepID=B4GES5_DROPE|nr:GL21746 [Drosophila persimilis]
MLNKEGKVTIVTTNHEVEYNSNKVEGHRTNFRSPKDKRLINRARRIRRRKWNWYRTGRANKVMKRGRKQNGQRRRRRRGRGRGRQRSRSKADARWIVVG